MIHYQRDTDLDHLHPLMRKKVAALLGGVVGEGLNFHLFEANRSLDRQHELFMIGRQERPSGDIVKVDRTVTNADGWESFHPWGFAVDLVPQAADGRWTWESDEWDQLHRLARKVGLHSLSWERPHLQFFNPETKPWLDYGHQAISPEYYLDLYNGRYPTFDPDDPWANHMRKKITEWNARGLKPQIVLGDLEEKPKEPTVLYDPSTFDGVADHARRLLATEKSIDQLERFLCDLATLYPTMGGSGIAVWSDKVLAAYDQEES